MSVIEENPQEVSRCDIVVAIPSFNESETIAKTTECVARGLLDHFGELSGVIVNCDNHSADGTREAFLASKIQIPRIYLSTPPGTYGKGNNLRNLFELVRRLEAKAVVVVEADINNIGPHWIKKLGEPVLKGMGYVCPLYVRHKYEATLTSSIVYPLTRCLYGRRVRQPNAGDFAFKGDLADTFLDCPVWNDWVQQFGVDTWMTTVALSSRIPLSQAFIGAPKIHRVKDPYAHLAQLFRQIVGTIFDLMIHYADFWRQVKWSKPTALSGMEAQEVETPIPVEINTARLHDRFVQGFDIYGHLWQAVFDQTVYHKLVEIRGLGLQHFSLPSQTWARILFDAAVAYRGMGEAERLDLLDALLPLYLGKVLTLVKKTERMSLQQAEEYVENECTVFEENKPHLVKRWE
ncbi:MAG: glycosyltransferase [Syntrophobacteraceae bacterium]|nr:glycosyltransferase [Syntrophobacteraceae bacterium]